MHYYVHYYVHYVPCRATSMFDSIPAMLPSTPAMITNQQHTLVPPPRRPPRPPCSLSKNAQGKMNVRNASVNDLRKKEFTDVSTTVDVLLHTTHTHTHTVTHTTLQRTVRPSYKFAS